MFKTFLLLFLSACMFADGRSASKEDPIVHGRSVDQSLSTQVPMPPLDVSVYEKIFDEFVFPYGDGIDEDQGAKESRNVNNGGGACLLDLNKDLPKKNEPLYLQRGSSGRLEFVYPEMEGERGVIALRKGQDVIISCPGKKNQLKVSGDEYAPAHCSTGNKLQVGEEIYPSEDLNCNSRSAAGLKNTKKPCAEGKGVIVELGFQVQEWIPLIETCHNVKGGQTFWSKHTIHGAVLDAKVVRAEGVRPGFSRGDKMYFKDIDPEKAYSQKNQLAVFTKLIGKKEAEKAITTKKYLSKGHLSPDADFLFTAHQFLTYFYVNVAGQWQVINAGNWLRIETNTRIVAKKLGADFEVVTGTIGVLKLKGKNGVKKIYLSADKIPVPEYFYKVLRNIQDDSCIAFVITNNPYLTRAPKEICNDIRLESGWLPQLNNDLSKGYVYSCNYKDIKAVVPEIPEMQCSSVLRGSEEE